MCSTCGSDFYGQNQPEARKADRERLERVRKAAELKSLTKIK